MSLYFLVIYKKNKDICNFHLPGLENAVATCETG